MPLFFSFFFRFLGARKSVQEISTASPLVVLVDCLLVTPANVFKDNPEVLDVISLTSFSFGTTTASLAEDSERMSKFFNYILKYLGINSRNLC